MVRKQSQYASLQHTEHKLKRWRKASALGPRGDDQPPRSRHDPSLPCVPSVFRLHHLSLHELLQRRPRCTSE
jgi:hypothetical protein